MQYTDEEISAAYDMGMREDGQAKWNEKHEQAGADVANRKPEWSQLSNAL